MKHELVDKDFKSSPQFTWAPGRPPLGGIPRPRLPGTNCSVFFAAKGSRPSVHVHSSWRLGSGPEA
jgi:hypothetical protein